MKLQGVCHFAVAAAALVAVSVPVMEASAAAYEPITAPAQATAAQSKPRKDSLPTLRNAHNAVYVFNGRLLDLIHAQRFGSFPITCGRTIGKYCFGPENGGVEFGSPALAVPILFRVSPEVLAPQMHGMALGFYKIMLKRLDDYQKKSPGDEWIMGQRVFQRVQRGDLDSALSVAKDCRTVAWWCAAMVGVTNHVLDRHAAADSALRRALELMPRETRCEWESAEDLVYGDELASWYNGLDCAAREAANETLWWLSDPLFITDGNERHSEHFFRVAFGILFGESAKESPGKGRPIPVLSYRHSDWSFWGNGELMPVLRALGVPSYAVMESRPFILEYLPNGTSRPVPDRLYPVRFGLQYPAPTYHFIPAVSAVRAPFSAPSSSWNSYAPSAPERYKPRFGTFADLEHQAAWFRRGDSARLVAAAGIAYLGAADSTVDQLVASGLVLSTGPRDMRRHAISVVRGVLRFDGSVPAESAVVSMETLASGVGAARARFGSGPPNMPAQRVSLSDVLLIDAALQPVESLDEAAPRALYRTVIAEGASIGLFWEVYGLAQGDSVSFSVTAVDENPSALTRIAGSIGLVREGRTTSSTWTEAVAATAAVSPRLLTLNLSSLPPGVYSLQVEASVPGQQVVRVAKLVEIRRRG